MACRTWFSSCRPPILICIACVCDVPNFATIIHCALEVLADYLQHNGILKLQMLWKEEGGLQIASQTRTRIYDQTKTSHICRKRLQLLWFGRFSRHMQEVIWLTLNSCSFRACASPISLSVLTVSPMLACADGITLIWRSSSSASTRYLAIRPDFNHFIVICMLIRLRDSSPEVHC